MSGNRIGINWESRWHLLGLLLGGTHFICEDKTRGHLWQVWYQYWYTYCATECMFLKQKQQWIKCCKVSKFWIFQPSEHTNPYFAPCHSVSMYLKMQQSATLGLMWLKKMTMFWMIPTTRDNSILDLTQSMTFECIIFNSLELFHEKLGSNETYFPVIMQRLLLYIAYNLKQHAKLWIIW